MRCEEGATLHKTWTDAVRDAPKDNWQPIFWLGRKPYEEHSLTCYICQQYEQGQRAKRLGINVSMLPRVLTGNII